MKLKYKISRLLFAGFQGSDFAGIEKLLDKYPLGGVIFFKRNITGAQNLKNTIHSIRDFSLKKWGNAPLIGVDQEGGRVSRLEKPFSTLPSNGAIGRLKSKRLAYLKSRLIALELAITGFNLDFHPVLDLNTNPENKVIGDRSFGSNPEIVSMLGVESIRGLHSGGIIAVGKHFPGHGNTEEDSHEELPTLLHSLDELLEREIIPFKNAIESGIDAIMPAHIVYEGIDENPIPATFSKNILSAVLKKKLGFEGIVISDDLEMKAISDNYTVRDASLLSLKAGIDMILFCHSYDKQIESIETLERAVKENECKESIIDMSLKKIKKIREKTEQFQHPEFPDTDDIKELLNTPELCKIRSEISELIEGKAI